MRDLVPAGDDKNVLILSTTPDGAKWPKRFTNVFADDTATCHVREEKRGVQSRNSTPTEVYDHRRTVRETDGTWRVAERLVRETDGRVIRAAGRKRSCPQLGDGMRRFVKVPILDDFRTLQIVMKRR